MNLVVPNSFVQQYTFYELCAHTEAARFLAEENDDPFYLHMFLAHEQAMELYKKAIMDELMYEFLAKRH